MTVTIHSASANGANIARGGEETGYSYVHVWPGTPPDPSEKSSMNKVKKMLLSRVAKATAVAAASLTVVLATTETANAAIYWNDVQLVNQATQQCLGGYTMNGTDAVWGQQPISVPGCMAGGTDQIMLVSAQADSYGHANVWIEVKGSGLCLETTNGYLVHPNGPGSVTLLWENCSLAKPGEIWSMITDAPAQNVGNPAGLKHFINFYNAAQNVCLDGGVGVYGFGGSCSTANNWQIWNIYTNQSSS